MIDRCWIVFENRWSSDGQYDSIAGESEKVFEIYVNEIDAHNLRPLDFYDRGHGDQVTYKVKGPFPLIK